MPQEPAENPDPSLAILREALQGTDKSDSRAISGEEICALASRVKRDQPFADELTSLVFGDDFSPGDAFYNQLEKVESCLGFRGECYRLVGAVWANAMQRLDPSEQRELLNRMVDSESVRFFCILNALPPVIEATGLPATFLLPWFLRLRARIRNDEMQGGLWQSLEQWALHHSNEALEGLKQLLTLELNEPQITIGACLLGNLRVAWERGTPSEDRLQLDRALARHGDVNIRLIHHRAWIHVAWARGLTDEEFSAALNAMASGTAQERNEAFNFLRCALLSQKVSSQSAELGVSWLQSHSTNNQTDTAKQWVINVVCGLAKQVLDSPEQRRRHWKLIASVQPVPEQNQSIWQQIEHLLVDLLHHDIGTFEELLLALLDSNPRGIIHIFEAPRRFEYLLSQMAMHPNRGFFASYMFSVQQHRREFGFTLFDEVPFREFPDGVLVSKTDDEIALALLEFRLHHFRPENTFSFLAAIRERIEGSSPAALIALYREELLYHMKSLPGSCHDGFKPIAEKSELVRDIVEKVEAYFVALRKCHRSAISSMEIPGYRRAFGIRATRQSKDIHSKSEELSVFANFFSTSYLIYNTQSFCYCRDGVLGEVSDLKPYSVEMEMPRLPLIDPEGYVIRRHRASRSIDALEAKLSGKEQSS